MPQKSELVIYQVTLPEKDGFDVTAFVVEDPDFDARTSFDSVEFADEIKAWERDEWRGVGVIVEASRGGIVLGDASIWGSAYGRFGGKHVEPIGEDGSDNSGYLEEQINEALDAAKAKLAEIN